MYKLTEEGRKYLEKGLPEKRLVELLKKGPLPMSETRSVEDFSIAIQWVKRNGWVKIKKGIISLVAKDIEVDLQKDLENVKAGKLNDFSLQILLSRNLIEKEGEDLEKKAQKYLNRELANIPTELIKTGLWRKAKLKKYNVEFTGEKIYPGKAHILSSIVENIRRIFLDLGFTEAQGSFIESSFWNFDALYQPQDHPARDMADTFYIKDMKSKLPETGTVNAVKAAHERGGNTGSTGWGYEWKEDIAKQPVLRTHTTAVSARKLREIEPPAKVFCIGRVFRNETINYKSLTQFTQIEGIVVDENVGFRDLLGYLKEFYKSTNIPILMISGSHDELFDIEKIKESYNLIANNNKKLISLEDVTHTSIIWNAGPHVNSWLEQDCFTH